MATDEAPQPSGDPRTPSPADRSEPTGSTVERRVESPAGTRAPIVPLPRSRVPGQPVVAVASPALDEAPPQADRSEPTGSTVERRVESPADTRAPIVPPVTKPRSRAPGQPVVAVASPRLDEAPPQDQVSGLAGVTATYPASRPKSGALPRWANAILAALILVVLFTTLLLVTANGGGKAKNDLRQQASTTGASATTAPRTSYATDNEVSSTTATSATTMVSSTDTIVSSTTATRTNTATGPPVTSVPSTTAAPTTISTLTNTTITTNTTTASAPTTTAQPGDPPSRL